MLLVLAPHLESHWPGACDGLVAKAQRHMGHWRLGRPTAVKMAPAGALDSQTSENVRITWGWRWR